LGLSHPFQGGRDSLVEECEAVAMSNQGVMSGYVIADWCKGGLVTGWTAIICMCRGGSVKE